MHELPFGGNIGELPLSTPAAGSRHPKCLHGNLSVFGNLVEDYQGDIRETTVKIIRMVESAQALPSAPLLTMLPVLKASSRMDDDSSVLISSCAQVTSSFMF